MRRLTNRITSAVPGALLSAFLLSLTGCAITAGPQHQQIRLFDLGAAPDRINDCLRNTTIRVVSASSNLSGTRMWYRKVRDPHEISAYAISHWSAPPATLVNRLFASHSHSTSNRQIDAHIAGMELQVGVGSIEDAPFAIAQRHSGGERPAATMLLEIKADLRVDGDVIASQFFSLREPADASPSGFAAAARAALLDWSSSLCDWQP